MCFVVLFAACIGSLASIVSLFVIANSTTEASPNGASPHAPSRFGRISSTCRCITGRIWPKNMPFFYATICTSSPSPTACVPVPNAKEKAMLERPPYHMAGRFEMLPGWLRPKSENFLFEPISTMTTVYRCYSTAGKTSRAQVRLGFFCVEHGSRLSMNLEGSKQPPPPLFDVPAVARFPVPGFFGVVNGELWPFRNTLRNASKQKWYRIHFRQLTTKCKSSFRCRRLGAVLCFCSLAWVSAQAGRGLKPFCRRASMVCESFFPVRAGAVYRRPPSISGFLRMRILDRTSFVVTRIECLEGRTGN